MTTSILPYQARHNALLDYLPNDLAKIVEGYEDNNVKHKKEWTIGLMKGVCREIERSWKLIDDVNRSGYLKRITYDMIKKDGEYLRQLHRGYVKTFVAYAKKEYIEWNHWHRTQALDKFYRAEMRERIYRDEAATRSPFVVERGVMKYVNSFCPPKKQANAPRADPYCQCCYQYDRKLTLVHSILRESRLMCEECDTENKYTGKYKTGFRSLPNDAQLWIIEALRANINVSALHKKLVMRANPPLKGWPSQATLYNWKNKNQFD